MNLRVASSSILLTSVVNLWLPYRMILSSSSFEREEDPWGSSTASTLLRISDLGPT